MWGLGASKDDQVALRPSRYHCTWDVALACDNSALKQTDMAKKTKQVGSLKAIESMLPNMLDP